MDDSDRPVIPNKESNDLRDDYDLRDDLCPFQPGAFPIEKLQDRDLTGFRKTHPFLNVQWS